MPTSFKTIQIKILTYGIYALMAFLAVITGWHTTIIKELPDDYVRLERYVDDRIDVRESLKRIESKIDQVIMLN